MISTMKEWKMPNQDSWMKAPHVVRPLRWNSLVRDHKHGEQFPSKGSADRVESLGRVIIRCRCDKDDSRWPVKARVDSTTLLGIRGKGHLKKAKMFNNPLADFVLLCIGIEFPSLVSISTRYIGMHKWHRIAAHVGTEAREVDGMGWRLVGLSAALLFCPVLVCFQWYGSEGRHLRAVSRHCRCYCN